MNWQLMLCFSVAMVLGSVQALDAQVGKLPDDCQEANSVSLLFFLKNPSLKKVSKIIHLKLYFKRLHDIHVKYNYTGHLTIFIHVQIVQVYKTVYYC